MPIGYAVTSAVGVVATLLLGGCSSGGHAGTPDLVVHTTQEGVILTEGGLPEIRLVDSHGKVWSPDHDYRDPAEFSGVPRGPYQLRAALRPCDGSCNVLDAPTLRCAGMVRIGDDHELWVRWSGMRACRVARE